MLKELGKCEEAIQCFDEVLKIEPDYFSAWFYKGVSFDNLGQPKKAIECYDIAIKNEPDLAYAWYCKGLALKKLKLEEASLEALARAKELGME